MRTSFIHGVIVAAALCVLTPQTSAITNLTIAVEGTNLVLSWPSLGFEHYIIQHRADFDTNSHWLTLTNGYPADSGTNQTRYVIYGAVPPPTFFSLTYGGNGSGPSISTSRSFASNGEGEEVVGFWERWKLEGRAPSIWEVEMRPPFPWEAGEWAKIMKPTAADETSQFSNAQTQSLNNGLQVETGFYRVFARTRVEVWGNNLYGQSTLPTGLTNVVSISAGSFFNFAVKTDGSYSYWGNGVCLPWPVGLSNVVALSSGEEHVLALTAGGSLLGWGCNDYDKKTIPSWLTNAQAVIGAHSHSLVLTRAGTVVAWGDNTYGQTNVPSGLSNVVAIAGSRSFHNLALKANSTVVAWGMNDYGQSTVPAGLSNVVAIAAGEFNSMALKSDSTVVGWGKNNYGQSSPPAGLTNVVAISLGENHGAALKRDGTIVTWGSNSYGQSNIPSTATNVLEISAGGFHTLIMRLAP